MRRTTLALALVAAIAACGGAGEPSGAEKIDDSEQFDGAAHVAPPPILTDRKQVIEKCRAQPSIVFAAVDETGGIHPVRCSDYLNTIQEMAAARSAPETEGGTPLGEAREPLTPVGGFFCSLAALSLVGLAPFTAGASAAYGLAWAVACAIL